LAIRLQQAEFTEARFTGRGKFGYPRCFGRGRNATTRQNPMVAAMNSKNAHEAMSRADLGEAGDWDGLASSPGSLWRDE